MKSEKIKVKSQPHSPGHYLGRASTPPEKTGSLEKSHPSDRQPSSIIDETVKFWEKRTGKKLSPDEAMQSISNGCSFFRILSDWNHKIQNQDTKAEALTSFHADRRIRGGKRTQ